MADKNLSDSRVLVTGATGFLGSHLCDRLRACGADVHAVSRSQQQDSGGLHWWRSALDDPNEVDRVLRGVRPDVVYHLGGYVVPAWDVAQVLPMFSSLLASTVSILVRATELGSCRVVLASASADPERVTDPPGTPYTTAKWSATLYARMFHDMYGTPVVVTRPFMTYGPREQAHKLIPYVVRSFLRGEAPRLTAGTFEADWTYVDDVVVGLLKAGSSRAAAGAEVELGTGRLTSVRDIVGMIAAMMRPSVEPEFGVLPDRPRERGRAADVERSWEILRWRAETPLALGLERTIAWHRGQIANARA